MTIRVYTDMVADLFHAGHVKFLEQAASLGDTLIVGLHSDDTTSTYKSPPVMSLDERTTVVVACRFVDEVVKDVPLIVTREFMEDYRVDLVVHAHSENEGALFDSFYHYPKSIGRFFRLEYQGGVSSSQLIDRIRGRFSDTTSVSGETLVSPRQQ